MVISKPRSNKDIPHEFKTRVAKTDRISRSQLTAGLKRSLGSGKRMSAAGSYLKSAHQSLYSKRSFSKAEVKKRFDTLKEGGFLKKTLNSTAARDIHKTAAARNRWEKSIAKNIDSRKKQYKLEERVNVNEKERAAEQLQKQRAEDRKQKKVRAKEQLEAKTESRLSRAALRRDELGMGQDLATRRSKGSKKTGKKSILAEIYRGDAPGSATEAGRPGGGWGGPSADTPKTQGSISPSTPDSAGGPGGGWSAPSSTGKKGL